MTSARRLLKRTPFYASHVERGAEMYEKGGWVRPARYPGGPVAEHLRVRSTGGIIDAHSMGKIVVEGPRAGALLEFAATGDIIGLAVGAARYTCLCAQDGGVLDDVIVYRTADEAFYLVTNTLSRERVLARLRAASDGGAHVQDVSSALAYIAVQGPATRSLLTRAGVEGELGGAVLPYLTCGRYRLHGVDVLLARTGYTGELGYELNFPAEYATDVWALLCDSGAALGIEPVGAQAMMTLRLEKGYRSYGADLDETVNPLEAGMGWVVDWTKPDFAGREALLAARRDGVARRATCLRGAPGVTLAPGDKLLGEDGAVVGEVTSGLFGPSVDAYVGLGYLSASVPVPGRVAVAGDQGGPVECSRRPFFDPDGTRLRA